MFTGANEFDPGHFSREQLEDILADNVLTVSVGRIIKMADVDAYLARVRADAGATSDPNAGNAAAHRPDAGAASPIDPALLSSAEGAKVPTDTAAHHRGAGKGAGRV